MPNDTKDEDAPTGDDTTAAGTAEAFSERRGRDREHAETSMDRLRPEDAYLAHFLGALALDAALKAGVIDRLSATDPQILTELGLKEDGGALLMAMLVKAGVCEKIVNAEVDADCFRLTSQFARHVLPRRSILERKLEFLRLAARDVLDGLPDLLFDLPRFMEQSQTFALFRYDKALDTKPENLAHTRRWADYVTALSESEAAALVPEIDLTDTTRLLEIGGNTGAFALRLLQAFPSLDVTVLDLPAVCQLGEAYAKGRPGADRLHFVAGDARRDPWPMVGGIPPDAVLFKSMLHDWPKPDAELFLDRARDVLPPDGRVIICERGPMEEAMKADGEENFLPFSLAANLVFAPFFRPAAFYTHALGQRGFVHVRVRQAELEMPFNLITATKPWPNR